VYQGFPEVKMESSAPADLSHLRKSTFRNGALSFRVAKNFCEYYPAKMARLREAIEAGDQAGIAAAAHALRGVPALFGAEDAEQIVAHLEGMGREAGLEGAAAAWRELHCKLEELSNYLLAQAPPC
jgi:HPt (histidine-containing phosphotransfer) domain-containing protein